MTTETNIYLQHRKMVFKLKKSGLDICDEMTPLKGDLVNMTSGVCSGGGMLLSQINSHASHNKALSIKDVIKQLGYIEFHLEGIRQSLKIRRDVVLACNINDLIGEEEEDGEEEEEDLEQWN